MDGAGDRPREPIRDGVLPRAKPAGVTSHDVVDEVRRSLGAGLPRRERPKVGHAGTLDPFATGLLLVLVGRATRAQRFFMDLPKTYRAVARLGWTSTTGDRDGELAETGRMPEALEIPAGEQLQTPPAYSAVKVGGRRAYDLARAGETPELKPRPITVYRADLLWHKGDRAAFEIECSSGTYVRSLVTDLGDAYCDELERTAIGPFRLEEAASASLEDPAAALVPLSDALAFMPEQALSAEEAAAVRHGRRIPAQEATPPSSGATPPSSGATPPSPDAQASVTGHLRLTRDGEVLAIGEVSGGGQVQPVVVFSPA